MTINFSKSIPSTNPNALLFILNNVDETLHLVDASKGKFNIVGE